MDSFSFIKKCLLTYNYPLVDSMSEDEIADIFKTTNRCYLISWMLKLIDSTYEEVLENSENDKELLSSIVHELGFCSEKEKMPFITGDLPVTKQVNIIYNIFKFISDIKTFKEHESEANISNNDLTDLVRTDLNLFPMYGEIKLLNPSERMLKMSKLDNEKDAFKIEKPINCETKECLQGTNYNKDIQQFIDDLKIEFPKIKSAMEDAIKSKDIEANNVIELKPNAVGTLKKCCENLKIISQFISDINTIEDFEKHDFGLGEMNLNKNNTYEMIKVLHREVLTTLKYTRCL